MTFATEFSQDPVATSEEWYTEFRCASCYQVRHEPARVCGQDVTCPYCQNTNIVPAYDENSLRTASQVQAVSGQVTVEQGQFAQADISREEAAEMARVRAEQNVNTRAVGEAAIGTHADIMTRGVAKVIDVVLLAMAMAGSYAVGALLANMGLCPTIEELAPAISTGDFVSPIAMVCYGAVYGLVSIVFWWMIAVFGQSPGKMLMGIKIVTGSGDPPGFLRGVVGRTWVAGVVMNLLPLGGLIDYGMACVAEPPRCVHDHIGGTYVIQS